MKRIYLEIDGHKLKRFLMDKKMSFNAVADGIGVSHDHVSACAREGKMQKVVYLSLCRYLGVDESFFLLGSDDNMIVNAIGTPAALEQLAEECCELGHAALKMARIMRGENPTPVKAAEAMSMLTEEVADIRVCLNALRDMIPETAKLEASKMQRWKDRINEGV